MELTYLTFVPSEDRCVRLKSPLGNLREDFDMTSCCDYLIAHQKSHAESNQIETESTQVEHWWKRKWQVSLDYYLSSSSEKTVSPSQSLPANPSQTMVDFALPNEQNILETPLVQALLERKTHRKFQNIPLSIPRFSTILAELNEEIFSEVWNYYLVIFNVEGISPGLYRYSNTGHGLILVKLGLFRDEMVKILCGMTASLSASFLVILSVNLEEAFLRYPYNRALREIYIDSGRLAQKLLLKGMQNAVGGLPSPAMQDSQICSFLDIDQKKCIPIYTIAMGIIPEATQNSRS